MRLRMCTLAVYVRAWEAWPVLIAANRDEFLSRPTSPPRLLDPVHRIFGGRDDVAGGTWLGVNARGMAAALLNRRTTDPPDPSRLSRGALCLEALRQAGAAAAHDWLERQDPAAYNAFNLLVVDREAAWVATNHAGELDVRSLPEGLHLLTNLDVNDPTCPRIAASVRLFGGLLGAVPDPADPRYVERLREILASHDTELDPRLSALGNSLCVHAGEYGTRSSTLAFLDADARWTFLHADSPPCRGRYERLDIPWAAAPSSAP